MNPMKPQRRTFFLVASGLTAQCALMWTIGRLIGEDFAWLPPVCFVISMFLLALWLTCLIAPPVTAAGSDTQASRDKTVQSTENYLKTILRHMPAGLLVVSADGTIEFANRPCEQLFGTAIENLIYKRITDVIDIDWQNITGNQAPLEMSYTLNLRGGPSIEIRYNHELRVARI